MAAEDYLLGDWDEAYDFPEPQLKTCNRCGQSGLSWSLGNVGWVLPHDCSYGRAQAHEFPEVKP